MEENTFEIFEGELGVQLKEEPPPKPVRQLRRADAQSSKRKKEAPPSPRGVPRETPRPLPSPPVLSTPELTDEENPWEGVTLNRCLLVAVIIIVISSGVNSVNETLGAFWGSEEGEEPMEDLALTSTGLQQDNSPEQTESSLWDSLFWWSWGSKDDSSDDDDDDDGQSPLSSVYEAKQ
ncbi:hypothetical protein MATL_G00029860 [Megalops atlanticus]|uniref:Uncharacterized protein n=1 Tax=Megalops atlanticus TaxID=7932 RepID=A0A9D3QDZ3_MEGAT|nr:hypothetical protein MATL_G00029860 [Megalops atlanticus]